MKYLQLIPVQTDCSQEEFGANNPSLSVVLEKEMAPPSGILAWEIPWKEKPGELQSMELQTINSFTAEEQGQISGWGTQIPQAVAKSNNNNHDNNNNN